MELRFNNQGILLSDLNLSITEFEQLFGYNNGRKKKIKSLIEVAKILHSFNCREMYIGGSFVTNKEHPNDIDICFDLTEVNVESFIQNRYEFTSSKSLEKLHERRNLHIFY